MKERPIIFNNEMVRAILDGRKTQTRRPVKPENGDPFRKAKKETGSTVAGVWHIEDGLGPGGLGTYHRCPYGRPGDRLWVRECWAKIGDNRDDAFATPHGVYFRADEATSRDLKWRPSIHMPRWASRITLEITAVRVKRVQDISEEDAMAEGLEICGTRPRPDKWGLARVYGVGFKCLWDSIYGTTEYAWANNPWVWVVEFRRVEA